MRILPAALVVSAVLHGGAIAWAVAHKIQATPEVSTPSPIEIVVVQPDSAPVEVALLDRHTVLQPTIAPPTHDASRSVRHAPTSQLVATTLVPTTTPPKPERPPPEPVQPHSPFMSMRDREQQPQLTGPSGRFVDDFLAHGAPVAPNPIASEQLHAELASGEDHLHDPRWIANHSGPEVAAERQRTLIARHAQDSHELQHKGTGYEAKHAVFTGQVEADGTAHLEKKRRYDPTEIIMNRHDIDPYASNKLRMLDDTREERYAIGEAYKHGQLARSAVIAQQNLTYLWARTTDPTQRKTALFEMWDECAERGAPELVAGGAAARAMIVGFIKARMVGRLAYTTEELAALNARKKSSATFAPQAD